MGSAKPITAISANMATIGRALLLSIFSALSGCSTPKPYIPSRQPPAIADSFRCDSAIISRPRWIELPQVAVDKSISGWTITSYTLDGSGFAKDIHIERSDPPGVFDERAITGVRLTRFAEGFKKDRCKQFGSALINCGQDCPDFPEARGQTVAPPVGSQ